METELKELLTRYLDQASAEEKRNLVQSYRSLERYFLDNITKWILELEDGYGIPFEGNYSSWLAQKLQILANSEKKESARLKSMPLYASSIRHVPEDWKHT